MDEATEKKSLLKTELEGYPFPANALLLVIAVGWDIGETGDADVGVDKATD